MTHPCCISTSSKSPPSTPLILSRFRHKASSKITCKSHLHTTFIQKCLSLLSFQQSKEIPIICVSHWQQLQLPFLLSKP